MRIKTQTKTTGKIKQTLFTDEKHDAIDRDKVKNIIANFVKDGKKYQLATLNNGEIRSAVHFTKSDLTKPFFSNKYVYNSKEYYNENHDRVDDIRGFVLYEYQ